MRSYISRRKYSILKEGVDFYELQENVNGGTRAKKLVYIPAVKRKAIFKFDNGKKFRKGEDCSEKLASEFAKALHYPTAEIDLAESIIGEPGLLSYLFVDKDRGESHEDMESYLDINKQNESTEYTIKNMETVFKMMFSDASFEDFLRILFFDALIGERDRHIGNWGILTKNGKRRVSPLYDTANCLLTHFQDENYRRRVLAKENGFISFINQNKTAIYRDDSPKNYSPTDSVIDYLLCHYPEFTKHEIKNLKRLNDGIIENIIKKLPESRMDNELKRYIVQYVKIQKDIIIKKGERNGC